VRLGKSKNIMNALYKGVIVTTIISIIGFYIANLYLTGGNLGIFASAVNPTAFHTSCPERREWKIGFSDG
jgi:Na+/H+-translocating membrane pyrophosphatase